MASAPRANAGPTVSWRPSSSGSVSSSCVTPLRTSPPKTLLRPTKAMGNESSDGSPTAFPTSAMRSSERLTRAAGVSPPELHLDAPPASSFHLGRRQLDGGVSILSLDELGGAIEGGVCLLDR